MSALRSAVDELAGEELDVLPDRNLLDQVAELSRDIAALEAQRSRRIAEIDHRLAFEADGALSMTAWLRHRCGMPAGVARGQVRIARELRHMGETRAAFEASSLDLDAVRTLTAARRRHPEAYARDEAPLVESAQNLSSEDLRRLVEYWAQAIDYRQALVDHEARFRRRRLHVSRTFGGMVRLDGDLDPEGGEIVITALRSLAESSALDSEDERTPAQARADALVEICKSALDHGDTFVSGGERPHLTLLVDLETLERRAGRRAETEDGTVLHPETIRRLACDAGVCRVITRGKSEPLDVGRRTRVIPSAIRRALVVRDGGCTAPGCDRPPRWCDAHHIRHWVEQGPTRLDNLRLLCRRHHRMHHEGAVLARGP
jgi:hypothetical protein